GRRPGGRRTSGRDARLPRGREALRRLDRAQDGAGPRPAGRGGRHGGAGRVRRAPRAGAARGRRRRGPRRRAGARPPRADRRVGTRPAGRCVVLGRGGICTEAIGDVAFAAAPLTLAEARRMVGGLRTRTLLEEFRGEPAVDRDALARILVGLGTLATERPEVHSVDLNPL